MTTHERLVIPLWPAGAPGSEAWDQIEEETTLPDGLPIVRNVTHPTLTVYTPAQPNGVAVIVAPGGAWHFLAIEHEGRQVAEWLAARGITVFLLKYRLIRTGADMQKDMGDFFSDPNTRAAKMGELLPLTLADAEQAVRIVRQRAGEWGVDPKRIGFMGFSAGGGVAAQAVLYPSPDGRPDFAAPIYPAIFDEVKAPADAPPLFVLCTDSDEMASRASMLLHSAWKAVNRPIELHIYAKGDHGFGMKQFGLPADTWIERFHDWLKGMGFLQAQ
jgi:acetyl esterase/lipase